MTTTTSRAAERPRPRAELRRFGLTVGGAFLALAAVGAWRHRAVTPAVCGLLGAALVLVGLAAPAALAPVERGWMRLAERISRVTAPVFMAVVYFAVLTPFGLVARLVRRGDRRRARAAATFWVERPPEARRSELRRQF